MAFRADKKGTSGKQLSDSLKRNTSSHLARGLKPPVAHNTGRKEVNYQSAKLSDSTNSASSSKSIKTGQQLSSTPNERQLADRSKQPTSLPSKLSPPTKLPQPGLSGTSTQLANKVSFTRKYMPRTESTKRATQVVESRIQPEVRSSKSKLASRTTDSTDGISKLQMKPKTEKASQPKKEKTRSRFGFTFGRKESPNRLLEKSTASSPSSDKEDVRFATTLSGNHNSHLGPAPHGASTLAKTAFLSAGAPALNPSSDGSDDDGITSAFVFNMAASPASNNSPLSSSPVTRGPLETENRNIFNRKLENKLSSEGDGTAVCVKVSRIHSQKTPHIQYASRKLSLGETQSLLRFQQQQQQKRVESLLLPQSFDQRRGSCPTLSPTAFDSYRKCKVIPHIHIGLSVK